ncbi:MAG: DUF6503 family protein [Marinirhabdus sp.]
MKIFLLPTALFALLVSCKEAPKKETQTTKTETTGVTATQTEKAAYPAHIAAVFEAHGGIGTWKEMNNLCFELDGGNGKEVHTTSLKDRKVRIEHKNWTIGHDGRRVWLQENQKGSYAGNARFYHNLMFYFHAMPFVLGDEGAVYTSMPATRLEGKNYNAVKVSYSDGVGDSPKDEYTVYSDPDTNQMEWLAYTVTYQSNEKSDKRNFIKYGEWTGVNGMALPKKITWYNVENELPTTERNSVRFTKITATSTVLDPTIFEKPEGAAVVPR